MAQGKAWNKEEVVKVLEPFFKLGCSLTKACQYAGIPHSTLSNWLVDDEELRLKIEGWQNEMNAKAREVIQKAVINGDEKMAAWWLERREKESFSVRQENINTNASITDIMNEFQRPEDPITQDPPMIETPIIQPTEFGIVEDNPTEEIPINDEQQQATPVN